MHGIYDGVDPEDFNDYTIYRADTQIKRKIGLPQLTAARMVSAQHGKKLFFGKPDPLVLLTQICETMTLQELEEIFEESM